MEVRIDKQTPIAYYRGVPIYVTNESERLRWQRFQDELDRLTLDPRTYDVPDIVGDEIPSKITYGGILAFLEDAGGWV